MKMFYSMFRNLKNEKGENVKENKEENDDK